MGVAPWLVGVAPPGETGFACAENGKEGREGSRAHGKVHKEQLTVKYGRLWDFILNSTHFLGL